MTVSILIFSAPKMSSFIRVGDMFGKKVELDLIDVLLKYMSDNGHV